MTKDHLNKSASEFKKLSEQKKNKLLAKLRNEVDKADAEIVELLVRRINLSLEIGAMKESSGLSTYDANREREIDKNISEMTEDPMIMKSLKRIYERIIDESRAMQRERER